MHDRCVSPTALGLFAIRNRTNRASGRFDRIQAWGLLMAKPIWREGRFTKNCRDCGAQTTGYVDTGKEHYAGLNPYFETHGNGTLCRERNCKWRGDERDDIRTSFVEWRSSD